MRFLNWYVSVLMGKILKAALFYIKKKLIARFSILEVSICAYSFLSLLISSVPVDVPCTTGALCLVLLANHLHRDWSCA